MTNDKETAARPAKVAIANPGVTRGIITDIAVGVAAGVGSNLGSDGIKAVGGKIVQQIKGDSNKNA